MINPKALLSRKFKSLDMHEVVIHPYINCETNYGIESISDANMNNIEFALIYQLGKPITTTGYNFMYRGLEVFVDDNRNILSCHRVELIQTCCSDVIMCINRKDPIVYLQFPLVNKHNTEKYMTIKTWTVGDIKIRSIREHKHNNRYHNYIEINFTYQTKYVKSLMKDYKAVMNVLYIEQIA